MAPCSKHGELRDPCVGAEPRTVREIAAGIAERLRRAPTAQLGSASVSMQRHSRVLCLPSYWKITWDAPLTGSLWSTVIFYENSAVHARLQGPDMRGLFYYC